MNTNVVVSLDTRRKKKDGSYPIIMRLGHDGKTTSIPLGLSIDEKDWDENKRKVKKTYTGVNSVTWLNNRIQKIKSEAMDIILKLHEDGILQTLPITSLKDRITQKDAKDSFLEFASQCMNELIAANRIGTARSYKGIINVLFIPTKVYHRSAAKFTTHSALKFTRRLLTKGTVIKEQFYAIVFFFSRTFL